MNKDKAGALNKYILDAKYFNVEISPPDINLSEIDFTVKDNKILFGLSAISGIGETLSKQIIDERNENGKFTSFDNLTSRVTLSKSQIMALIKSGAIPCKDKRKKLIAYLKSQYTPTTFKPVESLPTYKKLQEEYGIDISLYILPSEGKRIKYNKEALLEEYNNIRKKLYEQNAQLRFEKYIEENKKYLENESLWEFETLQIFIKNNPFDEAYKYLTSFEDIEIGDKCTLVGVIAKIQKKKDKNGKQFAFINIYSSFGLIEGIVWHSQLKEYEDIIKKGQQIAVLCKKDNKDRVVVNKIKPYSTWLQQMKKKGVI